MKMLKIDIIMRIKCELFSVTGSSISRWGQIYRIPYRYGQKWLIVKMFQSGIKLNDSQFWSLFGKIVRPYLLATNGTISSLCDL